MIIKILVTVSGKFDDVKMNEFVTADSLPVAGEAVDAGDNRYFMGCEKCVNPIGRNYVWGEAKIVKPHYEQNTAKAKKQVEEYDFFYVPVCCGNEPVDVCKLAVPAKKGLRYVVKRVQYGEFFVPYSDKELEYIRNLRVPNIGINARGRKHLEKGDAEIIWENKPQTSLYCGGISRETSSFIGEKAKGKGRLVFVDENGKEVVLQEGIDMKKVNAVLKEINK